MDNLESENLIREIKVTLDYIGVSQSKFAGRFADQVMPNEPNEDELTREANKIKKQLQRQTTKPERLRQFLVFIKELDEYLNASIPESGIPYEHLTGQIIDYPIVVREHDNDLDRSVIEVAAAYAFAVGTAWNFKVIPIEPNHIGNRYVVFWEGDVGHGGGSGSWGPAMCEVQESHFGYYYVDTSDLYIDIKLKSIAQAIEYCDGKLSVVGYRYGKDDANNRPSLVCSVTLEKNEAEKWEVVAEKHLGTKRELHGF